MAGRKKNKFFTAERISMAIILVVIVLLFIYFAKDIMVPLFKMHMDGDTAGASEILKNNGVGGGISVILIEALQMVVIFISAEFIQISSGLSYPIYLSLPLCDIGICLGATIIFLLVRVFNYKSSTYEKQRGAIDKIASAAQDRNTVLLLYLLFFMPFIPFGAICYYGSSTKLSYGKYMLTVATSAIPSVVVSVLIGQAGMAFLSSNIPLWLLVVIVIILSVLLFALIYWFMHKFVLKDTDKTPASLYYDIFFAVVKILHIGRKKPVIDDVLLNEAESPYILLANHETSEDYSYLHYLATANNPSCLIKEYYCNKPLFKTIVKHCGFIPKKLFTPDFRSAMKLKSLIKKGHPVLIYPEGRLSPDGRTNKIVEKGGEFYKNLDVDIVLVKVEGGYYVKPKWRKRTYNTDVDITVKRVLKRSEIASMSGEELDLIIAETLYTDASLLTNHRYRQRDKAAGLERLLYRCADCGDLYKTAGKGNTLICRSCGAVHTLDERYHFTDPVKTIPAYYDTIRAMEEKEIDSLTLSSNVRMKAFSGKGKTLKNEEGTATLDKDCFRYKSASTEFTVPVEKLPALEFKCGKRFELYHEGDLYFFYPKEDPVQVARWALIIDILADKRIKE